MRQPHMHYLIIGHGRVAQHFQYYLKLLHVAYDIWYRPQAMSELREKTRAASHILLLINDNAIEAFINEHFLSTDALLIHFSGSLVTPLAYGAHPLMSFNRSVYSLSRYHSIPFVIDQNAPEFASLLPGLPNKHVRMDVSLKAKYHALCVLSGNLSCFLWQNLFARLEKTFNIPASFAQTYLEQQTENLLDFYESALTGPLVRNDMETIEKNIKALEGDPLQIIYKSFVDCYKQID